MVLQVGRKNKYDYFPSVGTYKVVENKDGIVILKLEETLVKQVTKFSLTQLFQEVLMD
jgi:hypothetical protein